MNTLIKLTCVIRMHLDGSVRSWEVQKIKIGEFVPERVLYLLLLNLHEGFIDPTNLGALEHCPKDATIIATVSVNRDFRFMELHEWETI